MDISPIGCCRPNHKKLSSEDTALIVCNKGLKQEDEEQPQTMARPDVTSKDINNNVK